MKKIWIVGQLTFRRYVRSGTFLMLTLGLPFLMFVAASAPFVLNYFSDSSAHIGLVDESGMLTVTDADQAESDLRITTYPDLPAARGSYSSGAIDGYLHIPADYMQGGRVRYYAAENPGLALEDNLAQLLRRAQMQQASPWLVERLESPTRQMIYVSSASGQELHSTTSLVLRIAMPAALGFLLGLVLVFNTSQMGAAVVQEKEQRSMEMILTSLSPTQLVAGKVLGMTLLSLTQLGIWVGGAAIAAALALISTRSSLDLQIPWESLWWAFVLGAPVYFLYAILAAGLGVIAGDRQQARQLAGWLGLVGMLPVWFVGPILASPDSQLAVALTLFPLTGPIVALIRMAFTTVPVAQLLTTFLISVICLLASVWAVTRIFRAAMLVYGQAVRPRTVWRALRSS